MQVCTSEISIGEIDNAKIGTAEIGTVKHRLSEIGMSESSIADLGHAIRSEARKRKTRLRMKPQAKPKLVFNPEST